MNMPSEVMTATAMMTCDALSEISIVVGRTTRVRDNEQNIQHTIATPECNVCTTHTNALR